MSSPAAVTAKNHSTYTVYGLLVAGSRFSDFTEDDAVERYMQLHPDADEAAVRAELKADLDKNQ